MTEIRLQNPFRLVTQDAARCWHKAEPKELGAGREHAARSVVAPEFARSYRGPQTRLSAPLPAANRRRRGQGLWAAERVGADEVRVSYPGYIHEFPVDQEEQDDYMACDNLVDFAREEGWWDGEEPFNLQEVYGQPFPAEDPGETYPAFCTEARSPPERERELRDMAPIRLEDTCAIPADPRGSTAHALR